MIGKMIRKNNVSKIMHTWQNSWLCMSLLVKNVVFNVFCDLGHLSVHFNIAFGKNLYSAQLSSITALPLEYF
jgi:hypothetical protein